MQQLQRTTTILLTLLILLISLSAGIGLAAEYVQDDGPYELAANEQLDDDLYVIADEVNIDGTLNGDLFAVANYVHIQGEVTGDVLVVAGGFRLDGAVGDDVRVLAISSEIAGSVGDDLLLAGGGNAPGVRFPLGNRTFEQGIRLEQNETAGDLILYAIGVSQITDSQIRGDLQGYLDRLELNGTDIQGSADITINRLQSDDGSRISGPGGLRYRSLAPLEINPNLTEEVLFNQIEVEPINWVEHVRNIIGRIAGYALLGWILLRYRPALLNEPLFALNLRGWSAAWTGFSAVFFLVPLITIPTALIAGFFWGTFASFAIAGFIFLGIASLWYFSPLVAGLWIGQRFSQNPFQGLLFGVGLISILVEIPLTRFIVFLFALSLCVGSLIFVLQTRLSSAAELDEEL